jgi:hypothetical protein
VIICGYRKCAACGHLRHKQEMTQIRTYFQSHGNGWWEESWYCENHVVVTVPDFLPCTQDCL